MKYYRLYTIFKLPNVRVLDFQKVKLKEKVKAKALFESEEGKEIIQNMLEKKFKEDEEGEFVKAIDLLKQDEKKKMMIYVLLSRLFFRA
jgi:hypothetical protein